MEIISDRILEFERLDVPYLMVTWVRCRERINVTET